MTSLAINAAPNAGTLTGAEVIPVLKNNEPARTTLGTVITDLAEAHFQAAIDRTFDATTTLTPDKMNSATAPGNGQGFLSNWRFESYSSAVEDDTGGVFANYNTGAFLRFSTGINYDEVSSVNHSDVALEVMSRRGPPTGTGLEYLTDTETGQVIGMHVHSFMGQRSDGGALVWSASRAYVTTGGATSGIEGDLIIRDTANVPQLNLGMMVGSLPPFDNTTIAWAKEAIAFRAQLSLDSVANKAYGAFLAEDDGTYGFKYVLSAHSTANSAPYFGITGRRHASGAGRVHANIGTAADPAYTFIGDDDTGIFRPGDNNLSFSTGGVERMSLFTTVLQTTVPVRFMDGSAIPVNGSSGQGIKISSTDNFGIFFGSDVPTLTAAQGSLYLRSDGFGTSDRVYVNSSVGSGTSWTALITAT